MSSTQTLSHHDTSTVDTAALGRRAELLLVLILAGVQFSHLMDFIVMMPLGPQLMRVFGISASQFGMVVSVYTFSAAISCFLAALFMDRFDRKHVLVTIYVGLVGGTFLCGLAPSFGWLLAARVVTGIFGGLLQAVILAIVGDVVHPSRQGRATGIIMAAFAIASVVGVPLGLAIANRYSWHATFTSLGFFSIINLVLAWRFLPPVRGHLKQHRPVGVLSGIKGLLRETNTWVSILLTISMMSIFGMLPFISAYLVSIVGVTEGQLTEVYLFGGIASILISPLAGRMSDRYGARRVFIVASVVAVPGILAFSYLGPAALWLAILMNTIVSAVAAARMAPSMDMINRSVDAGRRGSFMTLMASVQQLSAAFASYGGGLLLSSSGDGKAGLANFGILGVIVAASMLVSSGLCLLLKPVPSSGSTATAA